MRRSPTLAAAVTVCGILLAGCGGGDDQAATSGTESAATGSAGNESQSSDQQKYESDAGFAEAMIPHHRQAVEMAKLTDHATCAQVKALGDAIEKAQAPEIKQMVAWLRSWGHTEWTPDGRQLEEEGGEGGDEHTEEEVAVPGMMTHEQMTALEQAKGKVFCKKFLTLMIAHHQGAIKMAKAEQEAGKFQPMKDLAAKIEQAQTAEIAKMKKMIKAV